MPNQLQLRAQPCCTTMHTLFEARSTSLKWTQSHFLDLGVKPVYGHEIFKPLWSQLMKNKTSILQNPWVSSQNVTKDAFPLSPALSRSLVVFPDHWPAFLQQWPAFPDQWPTFPGHWFLLVFAVFSQALQTTLQVQSVACRGTK